MSKLTLIPTPIGNLEDITLRAIRILKEVDLLLAEDTRQSKKLLQHLGIAKEVQAYHAHNEHQSTDYWTNRILSGTSIGLVSDAGTPGISDPGFLLVRACLEKNIPVESLPGPCALITALVASGLPCDRFIFEGFLPHKKGRQTKWKELAKEDRTLVLYESPYRIQKLLEEVKEFMGESTRVVLGRELTKLYEEYLRGTPDELLAHFAQKEPKGEFVVILVK